MIAQYLSVKSAHPDSLLFYRMGDFYEMFFEDAEIGASVLGITLTNRKNGAAKARCAARSSGSSPRAP